MGYGGQVRIINNSANNSLELNGIDHQHMLVGVPMGITIKNNSSYQFYIEADSTDNESLFGIQIQNLGTRKIIGRILYGERHHSYYLRYGPYDSRWAGQGGIDPNPDIKTLISQNITVTNEYDFIEIVIDVMT